MINANGFIKRLTHVEIDGFVEKIPSFTTGKPGIFLACVGITFNLFNMYTDFALGFHYLYHKHYWWAGFTLGFVLTSSFLISIFTCSLHHKSDGKFLMKVKVNKPLVYTLCAFLHGHLARCLMWLKLLYNEIPLIGVKAALWIFRDITSYAEVFMESIPQLCLQCYVVVIERGDYNKFQLLCCIASWLSASWGLLSQFDGFKWKLVAFELNLFWFAARALAVALLASANKLAACLLIVVHLVAMLPLWFWQNSYKPFRKKQGASRFQLAITDVFYSTIYATCNCATPITCNYPTILAFLLAAENITCYLLAFSHGIIQRKRQHFKDYTHDYKNLSDKCVNNETLSLKTKCSIDFSVWRYGEMCVITGCVITVIALLQVLLIALMKWGRMVEDDAMVSQLGSFTFRKSTSMQPVSPGCRNNSSHTSNSDVTSQFHREISPTPPLETHVDVNKTELDVRK